MHCTGACCLWSGNYTTCCAHQTIKSLTGTCRGNGASVLRIVPYAAIHFTAYESYRKAIVHIGAEARASKPVSPVIDLLAGSAAGATAVLITYPLDLVRTRLAFQTESGNHSSQVKNSLMKDRQSSSSTAGSSLKIAVTQNPKVQQLLQLRSSNSSIRGIIQTIFREEGVLGLYRGIGPTLAGILPYAGLKFYVYQSLKQYYWAQKSDTPAASVENVVNSPQRLPVPVMLTFGAGAGLVAQTLTYPLDVVRRRMQVQGVKLPSSQQNLKQYMQNQTVLRSTWHGLVTILQTQGAKALFAGLSINYMKVVPSTAIGFTLYDSLKSYLDLANNL